MRKGGLEGLNKLPKGTQIRPGTKIRKKAARLARVDDLRMCRRSSKRIWEWSQGRESPGVVMGSLPTFCKERPVFGMGSERRKEVRGF